MFASNTEPVTPAETWNGPERGSLLLCGGGDLPPLLLSTFYQAGQAENGRLVVIPSASRFSDSGDTLRWRQTWAAYNWRNIDILHAANREEAEQEGLAKLLQQATAVWISGGDQLRLAERYSGSRIEREIQSVLNRGGVVGGTSAGSAVATKVMIAGGQRQPILNQGLDLLPRAIVDQHFSQRSRHQRLASAVARHPDRVGIGIDEGTALMVSGRVSQVLGQGAVHVFRKYGSTEVGQNPLQDQLSQFDQKVYVAGSTISFEELPILSR